MTPSSYFSMLLLVWLGFLSVLGVATPIWPIRHPQALPAIFDPASSTLVRSAEQQPFLASDPLKIPPPETISIARRPSHRFDAEENSVGVLFTTENEVRHLWLPIGKRVYTREAPDLPLHPQTARITTLIMTSPRLAAPEQLDRIRCHVQLVTNNTPRKAGDSPEDSTLAFSKRDGLVQFERRTSREDDWWLGGAEVESFECS